MMKKSIDGVALRGKRVLVRVDFNVPLDAAQHVTDDTRIRAALPTIRRILEEGGRVILISHLGRPDEEPEAKAKYSLAPVAGRLSDLIARPVRFVQDCVGPEVRHAVAEMRDGSVLLLENLRFHEAEVIKDKNAAKDPALREAKDAFARQLASLADVYVNDAFGTCHRDNASMLTVPQMMTGKPKVVGYLVRKELEYLGAAIHAPKRPFVCVLGGAKVSDKIRVIERLLERCDALLIGGAMMFTFWGAEGHPVGKSRVEPDAFDLARRLRAEAGPKLRVPTDCVAADRIASDAATTVCAIEGASGAAGEGGRGVPAPLMGLDIGPATIATFESVLSTAVTIVWNGPMGVFETPPFDRGTRAVARAMSQATQRDAITIVGGGDSAAAVTQAGLAPMMTHVSTGGGASLEFLEGKSFAALEVLDDA
ncbi:MAG: phosphoglycerate kinase [Phycisphaerae bacterium]|nr:MAG: phosphoglycerate kinase [Planctomycetota bacterium]KAB2949048.1 MAG: phosphoglycerate kinase [Phycisphaerae bacterium]MBE7457078.1 phosphoglycerate kinase [Planctomycetia bacterium]MCK6463564.1 phosphoglycerate kinase [Phycisphaerae bacterium]MCL4719045.1 phosphoglycerate kinase [Phycisphaerae bacterium]